ncbi:MAG TPA: DUF3054 domain-containing protein [Kouleothrix sp.]|nr:DUF3054 domain-containing protein [Kouleothrix sp.]
MALTDHTPASQTTPDVRQLGTLAVGDVIAFNIVTAIGLLNHGELTGFGRIGEVITIATPFAVGWFLVAPFLGAFKPDVITQPRRMLARSALSWLLALPIGLLLWSFVRHKTVQPAFAVVTFITNMIVLLGWRGTFAWLSGRTHQR